MADTAHLRDTPHAIDYVVRSTSRRLVYYENAIHDFRLAATTDERGVRRDKPDDG